MTLAPRTKLLLIFALFLLPMVASFAVYKFVRPEATGNYGELLLPPAGITKQPFNRIDGGAFVFGELEGRWALVASDSGACAAPCADKLAAMRQVRIALGRNGSRLERVFVVDDLQAPSPQALAPFEGMIVAVTRPGLSLPTGAANDRAHIYLVDPRGNVMMRWPAVPQLPRMKKDLERLLRASQIG
jgi:hypothetical protein